jgi:hypothetical protein
MCLIYVTWIAASDVNDLLIFNVLLDYFQILLML